MHAHTSPPDYQPAQHANRHWPALTRIQIAALAAITGLAFASRVYGINREFWLDEATSAAIAKLSWPSFVSTIANGEINMVLYYLLLRVWILFGDAEWWLRIPSLLFGTATVPLVGLIGCRYWSAGSGLLAAALLALSPFHIQWGGDARAYSLQLLLLAGCLWALLAWHESKAAVHRRAYMALAILAIYAHLFSTFTIAAHALTVLIGKREERRIILRTFAIIALAGAPAFLLLSDRGQASWIEPLSASWLGSQMAELLGGVAAAMALGACVLVIFAARYGSQPAGDPAERWRTGLLFSSALAPLAALLLLSLYKPFFVARYAMPILIPVAMLAGTITEIRIKVMRIVLPVALLAVLGASLYKHFQEAPDRQVAHAAQYIIARTQRGDALLFGNFQRVLFEWYAERERPGFVRERTIWPLRWSLDRPGHAEPYHETPPGPHALDGATRVWLYGANPADFAAALANFQEAEHIRIGPHDIRLMIRKPNETTATP